MVQIGNPNPLRVDVTDLDQWASQQMDARSHLPRLIRSLIVQTNDQARPIHMRGGIDSQAHGYDGLVEATKASALVPLGRSVWEFGTSEDPLKKANKDYKDRTENSFGEDKAEVTFVFVTPRRWVGKDAWVATKKKDSPWKDIWVLEAHDLEMAFDIALAARYDFLDLIGRQAHGVESLEEWWRKFSAVGSPAVTPGMLLASTGRVEDSTWLLQRLQQDVGRTVISAASTYDVLAFIAGVVLSADEDLRDWILARTVVVREVQALRLLEAVAKLLIILPFDETLHREALLIQNHHVVLVVPATMPSDRKLSALDQEQVALILKEEGVKDDGRAAELARALATSVMAFLSQAPAAGSIPRPKWNQWAGDQAVRRAWLAGGWTGARSGDLEVIGAMAGLAYDELLPRLEEAAGGEDPLFVAIGGVWGVSSLEASWDYVRPHIGPTDLKALEQAVQNVLGAVDPALELPVEDRWKASVFGKARLHSGALRTGLANTLAIFGALGAQRDLGGGTTARSWASTTVWRLLDRANQEDSGDVWASMNDVLPQLAEAAPDELLAAIQKGLSGTPALLAKMFTDQADTSFGISSPHTGLLWALETVAWSSDYLGQVAELLARLVETDPGGRLGNRPLNSLVDVFRPWLPQTSATAETRLAVLESVVSRHRDVGLQLLFALLPEQHGFATPNHTPRFREWRGAASSVTMQEMNVVTEAVIDLVLTVVYSEPRHWPALIERIPDLPLARRSQIYAKLADVDFDE